MHSSRNYVSLFIELDIPRRGIVQREETKLKFIARYLPCIIALVSFLTFLYRPNLICPSTRCIPVERAKFITQPAKKQRNLDPPVYLHRFHRRKHALLNKLRDTTSRSARKILATDKISNREPWRRRKSFKLLPRICTMSARARAVIRSSKLK